MSAAGPSAPPFIPRPEQQQQQGCRIQSTSSDSDRAELTLGIRGGVKSNVEPRPTARILLAVQFICSFEQPPKMGVFP